MRNPEQCERAFEDQLPGHGRILVGMMRALGYSRQEIIKALIAAGRSHVGTTVEFGGRLPEAPRWRHRRWQARATTVPSTQLHDPPTVTPGCGLHQD
jgi:hypothetical protein